MSFRLVIFHLKFQHTAKFRANFDLSRDKFIHMTESERSVSNFGELRSVWRAPFSPKSSSNKNRSVSGRDDPSKFPLRPAPPGSSFRPNLPSPLSRQSRRILKLGRVVMKFATQKRHGAMMYDVYRSKKCNFYPIPITSKYQY